MTGRITSLFFMGSSIGMMVMPMLLGLVFDTFGGREMILVMFAAALLGLMLMIRVTVKR